MKEIQLKRLKRDTRNIKTKKNKSKQIEIHIL